MHVVLTVFYSLRVVCACVRLGSGLGCIVCVLCVFRVTRVRDSYGTGSVSNSIRSHIEWDVGLYSDIFVGTFSRKYGSSVQTTGGEFLHAAPGFVRCGRVVSPVFFRYVCVCACLRARACDCACVCVCTY
jgi:hypothetical protein